MTVTEFFYLFVTNKKYQSQQIMTAVDLKRTKERAKLTTMPKRTMSEAKYTKYFLLLILL